MNDYQVAAYIIAEWRKERRLIDIQLRLAAYAGRELRMSDIMFVIRSWVESQNENKDYHATKKEIRP